MTQELKDLVTYWETVVKAGPGYVSASDRESLENEKWRKKMKLRDYRSTQSFAESDAVQDYRKILHEGLLPVPYLGDIENARVILFLLNPGFSPVDYKAEEDSYFMEAAQANISQNFSEREYPLFCLDPRLSWTGGYAWWIKKVRPVVEELKSREGLSYTPEEAVREISRKIAAIELFPYHSNSLPISREMLVGLNSVQMIGHLARSLLHQRDRLLVFTRSVDAWNELLGHGLSAPAEIDQDTNPIVYPPRFAQSASLSQIKKAIADRIVAD